jgi:hypothetical protein
VIRLGLRLILNGGREAALRLVLIVVAVAVGVGLLLTTLASLNAVTSQNARYAWLETGTAGSNAPALTAPGQATTDPLWWRLRADSYQGTEIGRVDLAATGPNSPIPPGIAELPGPGEFYASPALAKLLRTVPAAQLGDRYPGRQVGTIGDAALPAPNSLIVVVGRSVAELTRDPEARQVSTISTTTPSNCGDCVIGVGIDDNGMTLILSIVVAALLVPVLVFIAGATRLSAARREQRFAAMRLVGATPRQISVLSAVESSVATVLGVVLGFGLFFAFRSPLAAIPFTGAPFFASDLSLTLGQVFVVALGIPIAAAVAARIALRRVTISPLGVTRRVTPRPPRAWRMIPLLAGLGELGYFAYLHDIGADTRTTPDTEAAAFLSGILLTMLGLIVAGPWLTMLGSRVLVRRASRPATLIAGRRLSDNPQAGFRAISGLVLAVFVGTCALAVITTIAADDGGGTSRDSAQNKGTLVDEFRFGPHPGTTISPADTVTMSKLAAIPGVTGLATIHSQTDARAIPAPNFEPPPDYISCAQLALVPALGRCVPGALTAIIAPEYGGGVIGDPPMAQRIWSPAALSPAQLASMPIATIIVGTDGSAAAVEQARTILDSAYPQTFPPLTLSDYQLSNSRQLKGYQQLANVVILASLPIAGCGLAVNVAGGLAERRRPFSLLRLTGAPLAMLRRVVLLEAAAPLLTAAAVSAGAGLLAAHLFLRAQLSETLRPPGVQYYLLVTAGLLASLAVIASTLPLLRRSTGPEAVRNE